MTREWLIDVLPITSNLVSGENSQTSFLSDRFEMLAEIDSPHFTAAIRISLTMRRRCPCFPQPSRCAL